MLTVLLSFAAFERELASERTRDKIRLSRERGQWMGGRPPLGYDHAGGALSVNPTEAAAVVGLFKTYEKTRSLRETLAWARERGITTKAWTTAAGQHMGGGPIGKSRLWSILTSPVYLGLVPYKGTTFPGLHPPIVERTLFNRVQATLKHNATLAAAHERNLYGGLLKGLVTCGACGSTMLHTTSKRNSVVYRYYLCARRQALGRDMCKTPMLPAEQLEELVMERAMKTLEDPALVREVVQRSKQFARAVRAPEDHGVADVGDGEAGEHADEHITRDRVAELLERLIEPESADTVTRERLSSQLKSAE